MTTDTTPQAIQEHLDYAAEVLPEIAEALRLLRGNATVLSEIDRLVIIKGMREVAKMAEGLEQDLYAENCWSIVRRLQQPTTRVILVREEADDGG